MKKFNCKKMLILGGMVIASLMLVSDLIKITMGASYTWFGLIVAMVNIAIVGKGLDYFRG